jgi:hypothetical protein
VRWKKWYAGWKERRLLRDFCLSQERRPRGAGIFNHLLIFTATGFFVFHNTDTYRQAVCSMTLVFFILVVGICFLNKIKIRRLIAKYRQKLAEGEYNRRIDKADHHEVMEALKEEIGRMYSVNSMELQGDVLTGLYENEKTGVFFRYLVDGGLVETRDVMQILHYCRQHEIKKARIFTNGEFSHKASLLGERYGVDLKLYNGSKLKGLLRRSRFYPSEQEIDAILKRESANRQRKIAVIKKEMLDSNKYGQYLAYSAVLLVMDRFGLGISCLNLFFAVLLAILAVLSLINKQPRDEEKLVF